MRPLLRKLGAHIFAAPPDLATEKLIRAHGRIVAVRTRDGWKVPDAEGRLHLAARGQAALYDSLAPWRP